MSHEPALSSGAGRNLLLRGGWKSMETRQRAILRSRATPDQAVPASGEETQTFFAADSPRLMDLLPRRKLKVPS